MTVTEQCSEMITVTSGTRNSESQSQAPPSQGLATLYSPSQKGGLRHVSGSQSARARYTRHCSRFKGRHLHRTKLTHHLQRTRQSTAAERVEVTSGASSP